VIEIKAHEQDSRIRPDGPHSSDGTRAIAAGIDSAFRLLNYATMNPAGLTYPSDVYSVLGELSAAVSKLPQALHQMSAFINAQVADGTARENPGYGKHGGNAEAAYAELAAAVRDSSVTATELGRLLGKAQSAISGLEATPA